MKVTDSQRPAADLTDEVLADEIELVGALLAAAAASEGPLTQAQIDEVLGLEPHEPEPDTRWNVPA
jgi:hypothetical protein